MAIRKIQLNDYLRDARLKANLSQKFVADELSYTTAQFISNWERGLSLPPVNVLKKIAALYKISDEELFEVFLEQSISHIKISYSKKFKR
jgi:transcriptional regulator with XRE-family HTH domain